MYCYVFCCKAPATTDIYTYCHTLSLHDALPISLGHRRSEPCRGQRHRARGRLRDSAALSREPHQGVHGAAVRPARRDGIEGTCPRDRSGRRRWEEPTSELQSLLRISYAVFCLKKKKYTR